MLSPSLQSLPRKESLYEQTYTALRQAVLYGEVQPGERLIETSLAEQLQVSRTPIREALRQLQREELVIADPSGGLRVPVLCEDDAAQLYDCRMGLEQLSVTAACAQATSAHLEQLRHWVEKGERLSQSPQTDPQALLAVDRQFHHLLAASSGNRWLVSLLDQVFDKMVLVRIQTTRHNPQVLEVRTEHRCIYEAVQDRDPIVAVAAIQEHLIASKARVIREIRQMRQDPP